MPKELTHKEMSKKGGEAFKKKYGTEAYSEMGKKGAVGKIKKYGTDYYEKISKKGVEARKKRLKQLEGSDY